MNSLTLPLRFSLRPSRLREASFRAAVQCICICLSSALSTRYSALLSSASLPCIRCNSAQLAQRRPSPSQPLHSAATAALPVWQSHHFSGSLPCTRLQLQRIIVTNDISYEHQTSAFTGDWQLCRLTFNLHRSTYFPTVPSPPATHSPAS
jgi:hypothetical protein